MLSVCPRSLRPGAVPRHGGEFRLHFVDEIINWQTHPNAPGEVFAGWTAMPIIYDLGVVDENDVVTGRPSGRHLQSNLWLKPTS